MADEQQSSIIKTTISTQDPRSQEDLKSKYKTLQYSKFESYFDSICEKHPSAEDSLVDQEECKLCSEILSDQNGSMAAWQKVIGSKSHVKEQVKEGLWSTFHIFNGEYVPVGDR